MARSNTPVGKRRLPSKEQRARAEAARAAGWGKLLESNPFTTRTSVKQRRREANEEAWAAKKRCVRVGSYAPDYTGQSVASRRGRVVCLSKTQWDVLQPGDRLGCGSFGCAYERPDGRVVKITNDPSDVAALKAAQGHKRVVKLFDAYRLRAEGAPVYAAIVERLAQPLYPGSYGSRATPMAVVGFARSARNHRQELRESWEDWRTVQPQRMRFYGLNRHYRDAFMSGTCSQFSSASKELLRDCRRFAGDVIRVHEHLGRRGFNFFDVHPGNIGVDSRNEWKFLDVGYSSDERKPRVRVLAGGHR